MYRSAKLIPNRRNFRVWNSHGHRGHVATGIPAAVWFCSYLLRAEYECTIGLNSDSYASCCVQDSSANSDNDGADDDTSRNTWYNETLVTSVTSVGHSTLTDLRSSESTASGTTVVLADTQCRTLTQSSSSTTDRCVASPAGTSPALISHPSVVCVPSNRASDAADAGSEHRKPALPPKPTVRARHGDIGCTPRPHDEQTPTTGGTEDCNNLLARVHALEQVGCRKLVFEACNGKQSNGKESVNLYRPIAFTKKISNALGVSC